ncbi:hypothetical protein DFP73DRAFT_557905 [Morchella snyderi]|nr:hypothetical protein DFP73DRAFT_557905 [Morchella snyderi]
MLKTLLVLPPAADGEDNGSNNVACIVSLSISALIALITGLWKGWLSWYRWREENLNDLENGKPDIPPVDVPVDDSSATNISNHSTEVTGKEIHISNVSFHFCTSQTDKSRCHHELPDSRQNSAVLTLSPGLDYYSPSMALFNMARRRAGGLCNLYLSPFTAFHYSYAGRMCDFGTLILYGDVSCPRPIISRWGISLSPSISMYIYVRLYRPTRAW